MAEFVQIGDMAFNPDLVTDVHFENKAEHPNVTLYFIRGSDTLFGERYEAFKNWWERHATVRVMP